MSVERVLVTGASGFIGRQTLEPLCARGFEVHAVSRAGVGDGPGGVRWHAADLLDPTSRGGVIDAVRPHRLLHLAWYAEHGRFWTSPENLSWVGASLELLRAFAAAGGTRAVVAGTCAEYAWGGRAPLAELTSALAPAMLYGAAKHGLHVVASSWARSAGVSLAWGRIFFLYGPHEHPDRLVSSIARRLAAGESAPCSSGEQRRDFLHVADLGSAFAALVDAEVQGGVNVASGEAIAVVDIARRLGELAGRPELVKIGDLPSRPGEPPVIAADVTRLANEVGWRPACALDAGLADALRWWQQRSTMTTPTPHRLAYNASPNGV